MSEQIDKLSKVDELIDRLKGAHQIISRVYMSSKLGDVADANGEIQADLCVAEFAIREVLRGLGEYPYKWEDWKSE